MEVFYKQSAEHENQEHLIFIHLQWFAPEDEGRTEEPTEHKIKKAREDGKVAKTSEFAPAVVLLFTATTVAFMSRYILTNIMEMMNYFFSVSADIDITRSNTVSSVFIMYYLKIFIPISLVAFIAALSANLMQVGLLFSVKPITPDLNRVAPNFVRYFKRSVFSVEALFNLVKTILKIAVIAFIVFLNLRFELGRLINLSSQTLLYSLIYLAGVAFRIVIFAGLVLMVLSFPDYLFQRKQHRESLKMTKQEIKEEMKQLEGDPRIKNMLMERMRELMNQNISRNVPEADVVITNPTHYSVALKYERLSMNAPSVTAKGKDDAAFRIREIAEKNDVPLVENKPLARALYAEVDLGEEVPVKYWEAVSIILSEVYRLNGKEFM